MIVQLGKKKRLEHIFSRNGKAFIVPVDDLLISGPEYQLKDYKEKVSLVKETHASAVLGYPGLFNQFYSKLKEKSWIMNLTTSTIRCNHTDKKLAFNLKNAVFMGCDAVAVHVNLTSPTEGDMISNLAKIACECQEYGIPLMAIIYARKPGFNNVDENYLDLKYNKNEEYTSLVSHACRVAVEIGADFIKTNYTGSLESFKRVIYASGDVPVIISGGPKVSETEALKNIRDSFEAGASGVCFGRNFFYRENCLTFSEKVISIIDEY